MRPPDMMTAARTRGVPGTTPAAQSGAKKWPRKGEMYGHVEDDELRYWQAEILTSRELVLGSFVPGRALQRTLTPSIRSAA
jgi:hypothetical protein